MTTPRIPLVDPATAQGRTRELLSAVEKKLGRVPNMMQALAQSPAALDGYLQWSAALSTASLAPRVREQIALTVGEANGCDYCLSAHSQIGASQGLSQQQIVAARHASADDAKTKAILTLARELVVRRGELRDADLRAARAAGVGDGEIVEVIALTALNIFTNYFNHVANPPIDFPVVRAGDATDKVA